MMLCAVFINLAYLFISTTANCAHKTEKYISGENENVEEALQFLQNHDGFALEMANKFALANWNYQSNLTEENKDAMLLSMQELAKFNKAGWKNATSFAWKKFQDTNSTVYRWFKKLSILGSAALPEEKLNELNEIVADMQDVYGKAKVCSQTTPPLTPCNLSIEPELTEIFATSKNYDELKHLWSEWRDQTGKQLKDKYLRYIQLSNEAACLNGFADAGELWREGYESETFENEVDELLRTLFPFYQQLLAYVRGKLIETYPLSGIKPDGPIPAHLLGNMWGEQWNNIFDIIKPFPDKESPDATPAMQKKKMTPLEIFKLSEDFFTSLGLIEMTQEFWNRSIIEKPTDRDMVCHASAWDFGDGKDFRIKQCTKIDMEDLITVHHEMGHIEYFLQYANLPLVFRDGANEGFHEAVGDTIALSVATPEHLKKVNLLDEVEEDEESEINTLMRTALEKIAFLPFGYLIDAWRWKVFDGTYKKEELNTKWWELRLKYQGVCPPVRRTNEDLDAASKYHVVADITYMRYFVSFIVQFQFHKALCDEAGYKGPLHKCDIYQNRDAGKLLSDMLSLGSSKPWKEAMLIVTKGKTEKMDAQPIIDYFEPLLKWLKDKNKNTFIGWKSEDPMECP
ncbi:hypothetical protein JTE90_025770 [Oedothorax gibbosus]|uniref:Angiotensin-converting enzyme n=1 Tax=Oedothorax gibbosus TaxID=931172 RepID=A0AAV6U6M1_9ARAC|nr:hypothetical protein JTE90_025770 [Oedothorax gibbosus]